MNKYNRILVIGNCGSGKSTLSIRLSSILGLPVIHLDKYFWKPGWQATPTEEWKQIVGELIQKEKWIMDGNYFNTLEYRMERADFIIFLDVNPLICLFRVLTRALFRRDRPDMPKGYLDRFDLKFYKYILTYNRKVKPKILHLLRTHQKAHQIIVSPENVTIIESVKAHS